ncbi:MAG: phenylalanine--tRNA ligase subunit beta [Gammaproteobacteria bacterium]
MKISEQWLREWVDLPYGRDELIARLTMAGLEVDAALPVAGLFSGVVVGHIVACEPHPEADKLRVCRVDAGQAESVTIVCGAPNARAGLKAPLAMIGATLPNDLVIKQAKLRGIESHGMLCGADELGIDIPGDGLLELPADAPVGEDLRRWLQLDDVTLELGLTPNRSDCLGLLGLAREVAAFSRLPFKGLNVAAVAPCSEARFPVRVNAPAACPRYVGRVVRDVDVSRPSPMWLREKLRRSGIRSIDAVVDITNFVMLELGQPMHAFDLDELDGHIDVRLATSGERITLLDGKEIVLSPDTLLIADASRPLAMAGIMGGQGSGVSGKTRNLMLESAFFAPLAVAGRARRYGLHTDSSHRFERGVDWRLQELAIERATQLVLDICGGNAGPLTLVESAENLPPAAEIELRAESVEALLGMALPASEIEDILARLGMEVSTQESGRRWTVLAPSYRFDIAIAEDLVEELARIYGYDRLPTRLPRGDFHIATRPEGQLDLARLRRALVARGYQEVVTYSFVDPSLQKQLDPGVEPLALANPISADMAVMRTTLWAGLLDVARYNVHRQQSRLRLFEAGLRFVPAADGLRQEPMLAGLLLGAALPEGWAQQARKVDFFDAKGDLEALFALNGSPSSFTVEPATHPALHPGQSARICREGQEVGTLGALHPRLQRELDLPGNVFLFEIRQSALLVGRLPRYQELSRFPGVRRDIALTVDRKVPVAKIQALVKGAAGEALRDLVVFDVYEGAGVGEDRRSVALGLTFQHASRTLTDDEVSAWVDSAVSLLKQQVSAALRE